MGVPIKQDIPAVWRISIGLRFTRHTFKSQVKQNSNYLQILFGMDLKNRGFDITTPYIMSGWKLSI
ncbi:hypothetical protein C7972_103330 [Arenibacter sp. ARW7G5Y1]|nr:hypothetical protein C7972_103330 [Arenibacter sp. ARW7G5Y1]